MSTFLSKWKTSGAAIALLTCIAASSTHALDIQWQDGRLWTDVDVTDLNSVSVTLFHGTSITTMPIADLPPDAQQKVRAAWAEVRKRRAAAAATNPQPTSDAGADITLKNGEVFHHASIFSVDAATASIANEKGIARVNLEDLPDTLRTKVAPNYSPERASALLAQEAQAQRAAAAAQAQADAAAALDARIQSFPFQGKITQCTDDGILAEGNVFDPANPSKRYTEGIEVGTTPWRYYEAAMILGVSSDNLVDGSEWKGAIYPIGHYQFTTVLGAERTVPRFTVSKAAAREYAAKQQ